MTNVVCILHGHPPIPDWLRDVGRTGRLYITLNDPGPGEYVDLPPDAIVTRNPVPRGFSANLNAALDRVFIEDDLKTACVVNFDLDLQPDSLAELESVLQSDSAVGLVSAILVGPNGLPTFSVGTRPTPLKEFLRASGLRSGILFHLQRRVLRRSRRWVVRNTGAGPGFRAITPEEYLPWSCVAISRQAWESVGPMDERFPLYAEDIDWSMRCHQAGWRLDVGNCGTVVHYERATRGERADSLYEYSHRELHRKWGWTANLQWQRRGLTVRRYWPMRRVAAPLDWSLLTNLDSRTE